MQRILDPLKSNENRHQVGLLRMFGCNYCKSNNAYYRSTINGSHYFRRMIDLICDRSSLGLRFQEICAKLNCVSKVSNACMRVILKISHVQTRRTAAEHALLEIIITALISLVGSSLVLFCTLLELFG